MSTRVLQKMLWHAKRIFRTTSSSGFQTTLRAELMIGEDTKRTFQLGLKRSADYYIWASFALTRSGVAHDTPNARRFVVETLARDAFVKPIALRRRGRLMTKDEVASRGLHRSTLVTHEFWAILNEDGRAEPIEAAGSIYRLFNGAGAAERSIAGLMRAGIREVSIVPNCMAAGPCCACLNLAQNPIPVEQAPIGPLDKCPHPNQCHLFFRAVVSWD